MKQSARTVWFLAFVFFLSPLDAAEDDNKKTTGDGKTDREMVALQKKAKDVETCVAQVVTTVRVGDQEVTIDGSGKFKAPGLMRIEKTLPDGSTQVVVNDGSYLWIHDKTENTVTRLNLSRVYRATDVEADIDQYDPLRPFRGVDWATIRYTGKHAASGLETFEAAPLPSLLFAYLPAPPVQATLAIHPDDGLLRAVRLFDADGNEIVVQTFGKLEVNREFGPRTFEFVVPAGAHPMDATEETIAFFRDLQ